MSQQFDELLALAKQGAANAYAPYSQFQVGAAIATRSGQLYIGSNMENASYGLGLCAERNAIGSAIADGARPGDIEQLVLFIDRPELFSPCGACRQVMSEFMKPDTKITATNAKGERKDWTMAVLLPDGFQMPE